MNIKFQIIPFIVVSFTLYWSYYYDNLFAVFIYIFFGSIFGFHFIKKIILETKSFYKSNLVKSYKSTILSIALLIITGVINFYFYSLENKETLIKFSHSAGSLDFKKDGTYVIVTGSWASRTHMYGNYLIKDSLITLSSRKPKKSNFKYNKIIFYKKNDTTDYFHKRPTLPYDYYLISRRSKIIIDNR